VLTSHQSGLVPLCGLTLWFVLAWLQEFVFTVFQLPQKTTSPNSILIRMDGLDIPAKANVASSPNIVIYF